MYSTHVAENHAGIQFDRIGILYDVSGQTSCIVKKLTSEKINLEILQVG